MILISLFLPGHFYHLFFSWESTYLALVSNAHEEFLSMWMLSKVRAGETFSVSYLCQLHMNRTTVNDILSNFILFIDYEYDSGA